MVIVFDLDDTLYDEVDFVTSGFRAVAEALDPRRPEVVFEYMRARFEAAGSGRVFDDTLAHFGFDHDLGALIALYRDHRPDIELPRDRVAVLAALRRRFAFGLVSDGPCRTQRNKFDRLGLGPMIAQPVFTAELGAPKPAKAGFEQIMRQCAGERAFVYVADNPAKDFIAPRALGWRTIRFRNPRGIYRTIEGEADVEIGQLGELVPLLDAGSCVTNAEMRL